MKGLTQKQGKRKQKVGKIARLLYYGASKN